MVKKPDEGRKNGRFRLFNLSCHLNLPSTMTLSYLGRDVNTKPNFVTMRPLDSPYDLCVIAHHAPKLRLEQRNPGAECARLLGAANERAFKIEKVAVEPSLIGERRKNACVMWRYGKCRP